MKLLAPIKHINGSNYPVETLLEKLALQPGGHYLLGSHEFWHGGVHITDDTITAFDKHPVCAIADGEIIAFRINENYPVLDLSPADTEQKPDQYQFRYSSSFCLVRHHYMSDAAPLKMQAKKDNPQQISQWVGRVVSLKINRNVRNPGSKGDNDNCTFRFQLAKGSRLKITAVDKNDTNFVSATVLYIKGLLAPKNDITTSQKKLNFGDEVTFKINEADDFIVEDASDSCTDWRDVKNVITQSQLKGYPTENPLSGNEFIDIPAGNELNVQHMHIIELNQQTYSKVSCQQTLQLKSQGDNPAITGQHPAGSPFYVSLTDHSGNFKQERQQPVAANNTLNRLTFYSLYMHLLPLKEYMQNDQQSQHAGKTFARSRGKLSLRDTNKKAIDKRKIDSKQLVELSGEAVTEGDYTFQQVYLVDQFGQRQEEQVYWINSAAKQNNSLVEYLVNSKPEPTENSKKIPHYLKYDTMVEAKAVKKIRVDIAIDGQWSEEDQLAPGDTFSYHYPLNSDLPEKKAGQELPKDKALRTKITLLDAKGDKKKLAANNKTYYVKHDDINDKTVEEQITAKDFDNVVGCAIPVRAGELLGYPGLYQSPTGVSADSPKNSKHQLHFEIFTADKQNLPLLLNNEAKLTNGKRYYKFDKGSTLIINTEPVNNSDSTTALDLPTGYFKNSQSPTLIRPWIVAKHQVELTKITPPKNLQADAQTTEASTTQPATATPAKTQDDNKPETWLKITSPYFPQNLFGWIKSSDDIITCCQHDLKTLGFTVIEESNPTANGDMFIDSDTVIANGGEEEMNDFFQAIFDEIDALGNKDGKLSIDEIKTAYQTPGLADTLQKMVAYHPTEWKKGKLNLITVMAGRIRKQLIEEIKQQTKTFFHGDWAQKWAMIKHFANKADKEKDQIIQALQTANQDNDRIVIINFTNQATLDFLQQEQQRIDKLVFWDEVNELKNLGDKVWHFHPLRFIETLAPFAVISREMLRKIWTNNKSVSDSLLDSVANELSLSLEQCHIDTLHRLNHFMAQVFQEVGGEFRLEENLNYSPKTLTDKFSYYAKRESEANNDGLILDVQRAKKEEIANKAYANRNGNGDYQSGDGWRYRGRGMKQLTGRANYRAFTNYHEKKWGIKIDFEANPDLLLETTYAVRSALYFWDENKLYALADQGISREHADSITKKVNYHDDHYADRFNNLNRFLQEGVFDALF